MLETFKDHYVQLKNGKMHYWDEGKGPVIIMVHGNPTWAYFYRKPINQLKNKFRVLAFDHLGMGQSDRPNKESYDLNFHAENFKEFLQKLGIDKFHLVVHDWGGPIALRAMAFDAHRVLSLSIMNTAGFRSLRIPKRIAILKIPGIRETVIGLLNGFAYAATRMSSKKKLSRKVREGFLRPYSSYKRRKGIVEFVKDIPLHSKHKSYNDLKIVEDALPSFTCPKLILWGGDDFCFTPHFYKKWCEIYPDSEKKFHPEVGHYLLEEGKEVVQDLVHFLEKQNDNDGRNSPMV